MKKILLLILFTAFAWAASLAQHPVHIGVKTGVSVSGITAQGKNSKNISAICAGLTTDMRLNRFFDASVEAIYTLEGVESNRNSSYGWSKRVRLQLDYINVPVLLKFYPSDWFCIEGGAQAGFLVAADATSSSHDSYFVLHGAGSPWRSGIRNKFKSVYPSAVAGFGLAFEEATFMLRYTIGLEDVSSVGPGRSDTLYITMGFRF